MKAFKPYPNKKDAQKFCPGGACRKEFWASGGVSVHKLKIHVQTWIKEFLPELLRDELARERRRDAAKKTAA
jgi:hypothetical protein